MKCRICSKTYDNTIINLGYIAISNIFITKEQLNNDKTTYPLKVILFDNCLLVQLDEFKKSEVTFPNNYLYFLSVSNRWLEHTKNYFEKVISKFNQYIRS